MEPQERGVSDRRFVIGLVLLVLAGAGLRLLWITPFRVPSESMLPTLLVGDFILVSKAAYGYSRYSFPLALPLFSGRLFSAAPERGDVVVFRPPADDGQDYVKRVIGLPGDTVQMIAGVVHINGQAVARDRIDDFLPEETSSDTRVARFRETLPNGVSHPTLDLDPEGPVDNTRLYRVPAGHFFMLGDNRDNSTDSRALAAIGYIPFENLVGRADYVSVSVEESASFWEFWRWPSTLRGERMFMAIR